MKFLKSFFTIAIVFTLSYCANNTSDKTKEEKKESSSTADQPNGGITLPAGFSASVFADNLGKARHIVVNSNGDVYTKIEDQEGYFVVFLPFKNGMPSGDYEIFADGFAGKTKTPQGADFRPCGLAQGPDGSL